MDTITYGSLFSGIGGFDLGFDRAGMRCEWQVENDEFCLKVLEKHWPDVPKYGDICEVSNLPYVDVICGGFPCQDLSQANPSGEGLSGSRSGLWHEMYRIVCEVKPRWVVVENVLRLLSANDGRDFGVVLGNLAEAGYDASWNVLYAYDVGAPHRRARVFVVANTNEQGLEGGIEWTKPGLESSAFSPAFRILQRTTNHNIPKPVIVRGDDGFSTRMDRLRAIGNAVVPQLAEHIGRMVVETDGH